MGDPDSVFRASANSLAICHMKLNSGGRQLVLVGLIKIKNPEVDSGSLIF